MENLCKLSCQVIYTVNLITFILIYFEHYRWLQSYRNSGIEFWGMTVQNEPITGLDSGFSWNTLMFTPEMEKDFVKTDLGPALEKAGWGPDKLNLMIMDHNRDLLPRWSEVVLSDKDAAKYIKGISVHWYANNIVGPEVIDQIHKEFPDYFILATEACDANWGSPTPETRVSLGNWDFGTNYANDIIRDLTHSIIGWVDWNMVLDTNGGPNWAGNFASAPIIVNPAANQYYKNPQFYALGHFSKFLTPGTQRIGIIPEIVDIIHFQCALFERPDGGNAFIVINGLSEQQAVIVDDPDFGQLRMQIQPKSFNTWVYYP